SNTGTWWPILCAPSTESARSSSFLLPLERNLNLILIFSIQIFYGMSVFTKNWKLSKDIGLLILRLVFGFVLIYGHGFEKLITIFNGDEIQFANPIGIGATLSFYLAAFAEGICTILLILGLF